MKQQWEQIAAKIDALSLRERGIMLAVLAVAIIFTLHSIASAMCCTQLNNSILYDQKDYCLYPITCTSTDASTKKR